LARNLKIYEELYATWRREIADPLKLPAYDSSNADEKTILKANVFTNPQSYYSYQFDTDVWDMDFRGGAHYVDSEPRFLASIDAASNPQFQGAEAVLRTEAARQ